MTTPKARIGALLREGLVVFAGVAIALAADDWRENQGDREELERSLLIVRDDLRRDSLQISLTREGAAGQAEAARWMFDQWDTEAPDASAVDSTLFIFEQAPRPSFSRAGYEGLLAENRLRLMRDTELRQALFQYYQISQLELAQYWAVIWERREGVLDRLAPHILFLPPWLEGELTLRTSWEALTSDAVLHAELRRYGGSVEFSREMLDSLQVDVNGLLEAVTAR